MSQSHGRIVHAGLFAFCFAIASASAGISQVTLSNFQLNVANPSVDIAITPVCPPTPDVLGRCQLPAGGGCVPNVTALECTSLGGVLNVGGHSAASNMPSRPLVPAPAKIIRPPFWTLSTIKRTARAICFWVFATASGTERSSLFMRVRMASTGRRSILRERELDCSVGS